MKKYLLCDWNRRIEDTDEFGRDPIAGGVLNILHYAGISEGVDDTLCRLIVIIQRANDPALTQLDLLFLHEHLSGKPHILCFQRTPHTDKYSQANFEGQPFFVAAIGSANIFKPLTDWLKKTPDVAMDLVPTVASKGNWWQAIYDLWAVKAGVEKDGKGTHQLLEGISKSVPALLDQVMPESAASLASTLVQLRLFIAIVRTSGKYAALEHALNKDTVDACKSRDVTALGRIARKKAFLDACMDVRRSLPYRSAFDRPKTGGEEYLLLVDDNPDGVFAELASVIASFLPGLILTAWKPDGQTLRNLCGYNSLSDTKVILETKVCLHNETMERTLSDVLSKTRFVLVDVLFNDKDGRDHKDGIALLRGLGRLSHDMEDDGGKPGRRNHMDLVALSRAEDMDTVQEAYEAGAAGYIPKNRLLLLPAILGRLLRPVQDSVADYHRNFRLLYNLPSETIGLLKTVKVPGKDLSGSEGSQSFTRRDQSIAGLLTAIPKTDLHVHVGSCMSPEFLLIASVVMLVRKSWDDSEDLRTALKWLDGFWEGKFKLDIFPGMNSSPGIAFSTTTRGRGPLKEFARNVRTRLDEILAPVAKKKKPEKETADAAEAVRVFRSVLHRHLGIPDYISKDECRERLKALSDVRLFIFALCHCSPKSIGNQIIKDEDDVIRAYLLFLCKSQILNLRATSKEGYDLIQLALDAGAEGDRPSSMSLFSKTGWGKLHSMFYGNEAPFGCAEFKEHAWNLPRDELAVWISESGDTGKNKRCGNAARDILSNANESTNPVAGLLATGIDCDSLNSYLEGCDFAGAAHLRHPMLIHLYAQQTVCSLARQGVLYAELRAAVGGYCNPDIEFAFQDACQCLVQAFCRAQEHVLHVHHNHNAKEHAPGWICGSAPNCIKELYSQKQEGALSLRPVKVGLILTGKRHKPSIEMVREAAAAVVLNTARAPRKETASEFACRAFENCSIVGFDLAGQEEGYAPSLFKAEFEQLSRMHIPITVHAGENATVHYIESAVMDLRARRIGHGLAVVEDRRLMDRLREEEICLELCPVSNHQTNKFIDPKKELRGRAYPLRELLKNGNPVCLNTDNPIISDTNLIKECFQASYAYGDQGLSLWELLRMFRMGFVHSFLSMPERQALLELADQLIFDLFSLADVVEDLRSLTTTE